MPTSPHHDWDMLGGPRTLGTVRLCHMGTPLMPTVRGMHGQPKHSCERRTWLLEPCHLPSGLLFLVWQPHLSNFLFSKNFLLTIPLLVLCHCCSVTKLCPTLCDPMNCHLPASSVRHYFPVCSNSCPLSWWWHPTISSSVTLFSSYPQSFPTSGSFPTSQLFASGSQTFGASVSASVLPINIQGWFPSGLINLNSLQSKRFPRVFSNGTIWKVSILWCSAFFMIQLSHLYMTTAKTMALMAEWYLCFLIWSLGLS